MKHCHICFEDVSIEIDKRHKDTRVIYQRTLIEKASMDLKASEVYCPSHVAEVLNSRVPTPCLKWETDLPQVVAPFP